MNKYIVIEEVGSGSSNKYYGGYTSEFVFLFEAKNFGSIEEAEEELQKEELQKAFEYKLLEIKTYYYFD